MTIETKNTKAFSVHLLFISVAHYETKVSFSEMTSKSVSLFIFLKSAGIYGEGNVYGRKTTEKVKMDSV